MHNGSKQYISILCRMEKGVRWMDAAGRAGWSCPFATSSRSAIISKLTGFTSHKSIIAWRAMKWVWLILTHRTWGWISSKCRHYLVGCCGGEPIVPLFSYTWKRLTANLLLLQRGGLEDYKKFLFECALLNVENWRASLVHFSSGNVIFRSLISNSLETRTPSQIRFVMSNVLENRNIRQSKRKRYLPIGNRRSIIISNFRSNSLRMQRFSSRFSTQTPSFEMN
jgi:hypothetical protein